MLASRPTQPPWLLGTALLVATFMAACPDEPDWTEAPCTGDEHCPDGYHCDVALGFCAEGGPTAADDDDDDDDDDDSAGDDDDSSGDDDDSSGDDDDSSGDDDTAGDDDTVGDDDTSGDDDDTVGDDDTAPPDLPDTWSLLAPGGDPLPGLVDTATIYDPIQSRILIVGGQTWYELLSEVWSLDWAGGGTVTRLLPAGPQPPPRRGHSVAVDEGRQRLLLFGGEGFYDLYRDVYSLDLSVAEGDWTALSPSGDPPPARTGHSAVFDGSGDRLLVFGGQGQNTVLGDTWALDFSSNPDGQWVELLTTGSGPPERTGHGAAWDPQTQTLFVGGGQTWYDLPSDLYALDIFSGNNGAWTQLVPAGGAMDPATSTSWVWDPWAARIIQLGGQGYNELLLSPQQVDFQSGPGGHWSDISVPGARPTGRLGASTTFVPERNSIFLIGGQSWYHLADEVWELQF